MFTAAPRVGRWPIPFMLVAFGACAEEPTSTSSIPRNLEPRFTVENVVLVTNTSGGTEVGSLRWAASFASDFNSPTIRFDPSLAGKTITLQSGINVNGSLNIEGPADKGITISGGGYYGVLRSTRSIFVKNVTITGGVGDGSAIWSDQGAYVINSTIRDNSGGAAIHAGTGAALTIVNSTVSRNTNYTPSAAVEYGYGTGLSIVNSTVAWNGPGPGIGRYGSPIPNPSTAFVRNSILAGNGTPMKNCRDTVALVFQGMNIVDNDYSCGTGPAIKVAFSLLYDLADNGGPTQTMFPSQFSPVINAGVNCDVTEDQRYVQRDTKCDIGAVEYNDFNQVTITVEPNAPIDASGSVLIKGTIKCSRPYDNFGLHVQVNQSQKKNTVVVRGNGDSYQTCPSSPTPWFALVAPWSGTFKDGTASVTVNTTDTPVWVAPAYVQKSVKLARAKP